MLTFTIQATASQQTMLSLSRSMTPSSLHSSPQAGICDNSKKNNDTTTVKTTTAPVTTTTEAPKPRTLTEDSFENGSGKWTARGDVTIGSDSESCYSGSKCVKVSGRSKAWNGIACELGSEFKAGNTYSFETLEALKALNPEAELYFIVGADTVCSMRTWKAPERIFAVCTILSAIREDQIDPEQLKAESEALARDFGARILPVTIPNIGISSTDIRERAAAGKSIHYLVPSALESYIIETGIYK